MAACTFFGHHDCPRAIKTDLRAALVELIEQHDTDTFYVGNQGAFDEMVRGVLFELKQRYPHIRYTIVLAYMPPNRSIAKTEDANSMLPEGIEMQPKRFAIVWRNRWMLQRAEYVVAYVEHSFGGAARFVELAEKQGKTVIHIAKDHRSREK